MNPHHLEIGGTGKLYSNRGGEFYAGKEGYD